MTKLTGQELLDHQKEAISKGLSQKDTVLEAGYGSQRNGPDGTPIQVANHKQYLAALNRATFGIDEPEANRRNLTKPTTVHGAGIINVARTRVEAAGFQPGDSIKVVSTPGQILITRETEEEEEVPFTETRCSIAATPF